MFTKVDESSFPLVTLSLRTDNLAEGSIENSSVPKDIEATSITSQRILDQVAEFRFDHSHASRQTRTQLQRLLQLSVRRPSLERGRAPSTGGCSLEATAQVCAMHLAYSCWRLPSGTLKIIKRTTISQMTRSRRETYLRDTTILFTAPLWLATAIVQIQLRAQSDAGLSNMNGNLFFRMENYNPEPLLEACMWNADMKGLERLFDEGKARETDRLGSGITLLQVRTLQLQDYGSRNAQGI